ncbi:hypothetical protein F2Q70_00007415 [Brassica cretica]|uniref:Alpha/beta hydrolase fold-3 domain-containing protein n=1 Tax=Brassica cretica TaxID=69181 RepID=A0A8S9MDQ3_BRACR|nr:hypothetical protein F2Q70_00007415 [Brassica cretica]
MLQFHGGGWVSGGSDSAANDFFCRRIAKVCDVIVLAVGYRLAPENRYPAAFEDGVKVLHWLGKQANLADCCKSLGGNNRRLNGVELKKVNVQGHIVDAFGASMVEPWLAAHADPSRCVLLGVSCGGNIADYVARKAVEAGKLLDPVKVVAQVLMYPFFIGNNPTQSEIKLANSYFYDKPVSVLAWKLFLPEKEFDFDHPAANPLAHNRSGPPLKLMPPTLTVVAEHDWMRDRAIAYAEELRKVNVDSPVLEYKDAVHEFATLDMLLKTPQAQACAYCGGNIADYVARKAVEAGKLLDPVKVVAQVLMYPFFIGNNPTQSEIKLANSYFYDKPVSVLAWKLFLPEKEFDFDHPAANPLAHNRSGPPLKLMPPTLTVVAEHDWMRDRAIAYAEELRKVNVDSPVLEYKDAVHEFATLDMLLKTPQAQACAEDIAIWVKKYISLRGHEFSY